MAAHNLLNKDTDSDIPDSGSAIGSLMGIRRPKYEILHDVIGEFLAKQKQEDELVIFISINTLVRSLFSEHATAKLTRGEFERNPRALATELINIAAHYRNFAFKHYGLNTSIIMYHSNTLCTDKLEVSPEYKSAIYAKRIGGATPEYDVLRKYVNYNITVAASVLDYVPHVHVVNTYGIDPEAWPWALGMENRVRGSALLIGSGDADLQYTLSPGKDSDSTTEWAVLRTAGDHSRLITRETLFNEALRASKNNTDAVSGLRPGHFLYTLALAGQEDLSVPGLTKFGMVKAAKHVLKQYKAGRLPATSPNINALEEEAGLTPEQIPLALDAWRMLVHAHYYPHISSDDLAVCDTQMVNRSGLGQLEKVNATRFGGTLNLELLFAGEEY